jgi:hypothetical protein
MRSKVNGGVETDRQTDTHTHTHTHGQQRDLTSLLYFRKKEIRLKIIVVIKIDAGFDFETFYIFNWIASLFGLRLYHCWWDPWSFLVAASYIVCTKRGSEVPLPSLMLLGYRALNTFSNCTIRPSAPDCSPLKHVRGE